MKETAEKKTVKNPLTDIAWLFVKTITVICGAGDNYRYGKGFQHDIIFQEDVDKYGEDFVSNFVEITAKHLDGFEKNPCTEKKGTKYTPRYVDGMDYLQALKSVIGECIDNSECVVL